MATQEKLQKSLEILENLATPSSYVDSNLKKRDKIQHCNITTEAISNSSIIVAPKFPEFLGRTVAVFLQLCDDPESDVRMIAEECLNRIIRALSDSHASKVQIELHRGIKRNGSARCLRAALWRFSQLAHLIRPHKGKAYVGNLFPAFIRIVDRPEEQIHETLSNSLSKIMPVLGNFASDNETKTLLKAFMKNISNPSAAIRRSSANSILHVCMNCRKPSIFILYMFTNLLEFIIPVSENTNSFLILGVMGCLKNLLPHVKAQNPIDELSGSFGARRDPGSLSTPFDILLEIYELCLYFIPNEDHNIVNSALETLNVLLQNATEDLKQCLLNPSGVDKSRIFSSALTKQRSTSQLSVVTISASEDIFSESELTDTLRSDIEKWMDESKLSVINLPCSRSSDNLQKSLSAESKSTSVEDFEVCDYKLDLKMRGGENVGRFTPSDDSSEKSFSYIEDNKTGFQLKEVAVGGFLDKEVALLYCARLISRSFLLTGNTGSCTSDKLVRVSVKNLALNCLASIVAIFPKVFLVFLDKNCAKLTAENVSNQQISDVLLFAGHPDPQLRGVSRVLVANFIKCVLSENEDFTEWIEENGEVEDVGCFCLENLVNVLTKGLEDESSTCTRQTLNGLSAGLEMMIESSSNACVMPILNVLPVLTYNSYWLVKVSLCELVSKLPYIAIYDISGSSEFQGKVIHNILFRLLQEEDLRVRTSAANAIVTIIPFLYFEQFRIKEDAVTIRAVEFKNLHLSHLKDSTDVCSSNWRHFIEGMPFPFSKFGGEKCESVEFSLSKIVTRLCDFLSSTPSKHFFCGCVETLSLLSRVYPSTVFSKAWNSNLDLLNISLHSLTHSVVSYDLTCHLNLLNLISNLYAGCALNLLNPTNETEASPWSMFDHKKFAKLCDHFLRHLMKLLNIFHCVLEEIVPVSQSAKVILPNLSGVNPISPIKRRKSDLEKKITSPVKNHEKEEKDRKDSSGNGMASFFHLPHYFKIWEVLKSAHINYKISLESEACEKFQGMLREVLHAFSILMEVGSLVEFHEIAEEILGYLKSTFRLEDWMTVECVQQLLKCLFGTNMKSHASEVKSDFSANEELKFEHHLSGFYSNISQSPYDDVSACIISMKNTRKSDSNSDSTIMGYLHRRNVLKSTLPSRGSDKALANYIRIFEPMVIKSLKQYTITSNVKLQCKVLQLLSQLIQLRVNYCLLDSEQIFIGFVLKQFEYIEEGQIPNAHELIPKIFQFLVQLSYSKQHSKSIISIPKIIQLCDGLMASGQSPLTHCIPALKPIVENIFLTPNKSNSLDMRELETTREVVFSMLLKLVEYREVLDLLTFILNDSKYFPEKWNKWSVQTLQVVLPMIKQNKLRLDAIDDFVSLRKLVFALDPAVFDSIDEVILVLLQEPYRKECPITRWLGKVLIVLLILSPIKEETLLEKISLLKSNFSPENVFDNIVSTADPLNVRNSAEIFENVDAETIFVRFFFKVLTEASQRCAEGVKNERGGFLIEELSIFLMCAIYIFQSGSHCKIANHAISHRDPNVLEKINKSFSKTSATYPLLTFFWNYFLTLVNYDDESYWSSVTRLNRKSLSLNEKVLRKGSVILFSDFMNEDVFETKRLTWFLKNCVNLIVDLINEEPVFEFTSGIHRNSASSKLFIDEILRSSVGVKDPVFVCKILRCLEGTHHSHTGCLLRIILPRFLTIKQISVSRQAANLASRKIELLLTMPVDEVNAQLAKEDLLEIIRAMDGLSLVKRHEALSSLLNKLCTSCYGTSPLEFDQKRPINPNHIKQLQIDKNWYTSQIREKCNSKSSSKETAILLSHLKHEEISSFMTDPNFNKSTLQNCIRFGSQQINIGASSDLFQASVTCLLREVASICDQVFNADLVGRLENVIPSLTTYLQTSNPDHPQLEDFVKFAVVCLESVNFLIDENNLSVNFVEGVVRCLKLIFGVKPVEDVSSMCCLVKNLYKLIEYLLLGDEPLPSLPKFGLQNAIDNLETRPAGQACYQLYILVYWLYQTRGCVVAVPKFILDPVVDVIVALSRSSIVNSFVLVPVKVWRRGWSPELVGDYLTQVPPLPIELAIELLQEIDVLEEFMYRITLLGWTSRQQFEETWMCLLSVLCNHFLENKDPAELSEIVHSRSLSIQAITSLLLQTLNNSKMGNSHNSRLLHTSRNVRILEQDLSVQKLKYVQNCIQIKNTSDILKVTNVFTNFNFEKYSKSYSYNQMSIKYLLIATKTIEIEGESSEALKIWRDREKVLEESGLDVNSCLQFLQDFYTQFFKEQATTPLRLLHEAIRSIVIVSDLFTDKSQFLWMLEMFLELSKVHSIENELIHQYLVVGICKAAAVLTPDLETYEYVKKLLTQYLKSSFLPSRIACVHGLLYILEGCTLSNITIGGISDEMQIILPCAVDYVQKNLNNNNNDILKRSQEHTILLWTLAFYLIENIDEEHMESSFVANTLQAAFTVLSQRCTFNLQSLLLKGLERLVILKKNLTEKNGKQLLHLALEKLKNNNPSISMLGVQLLLTYMYTDCREYFEQSSRSVSEQRSPEHLVQTIDKISAIFEHIKRGYTFEVEILCTVLQTVLNDFFSPSDILTKVIGEFLSPQQSHPKLISGVVFEVFARAIEEQQLPLLQDWVVFSLSSFTQSLSVGMATWCLTCFFISASTNEWLRLFFPYVQTRVGRHEYEDRKMLCIAGTDFYKNLTNENQKSTFIENFKKIKNHPDTLFHDLYSCL